MSNVVVTPHVDGYQLSASSQLFILQYILDQIDQLAQANERLRARVLDAVGLGKGARTLRFRWLNQDNSISSARKGAKKTDAIIDNTLTSIDASLAALARNDEASEVQTKAKELRGAVFANGVRPVSGLTYEEQHQTVTEILNLFRGDFADHVLACGLTVLVDQLERLNAKFGRQLDVRNQNQIDHDAVAAAEQEFREAFNRVLITILADYCDEPEVIDTLLAQYADQQERAARQYARGGTAPEVDTDTGEPIEDSDVVDEDEGPTADPTGGDAPAEDPAVDPTGGDAPAEDPAADEDPEPVEA